MFLEKQDKENVEIEKEIHNENDLMETDEMIKRQQRMLQIIH